MRVITDTTFAGEEGMVKVWNSGPGASQVTDEGHLIDEYVTAWVDYNDTVRNMIDSGQLVLLEGNPVKVAKKNLKVKSRENELPQETSLMSEVDSDHLLAAPADGEKSSDVIFTLDDSKLD